MFVSTANTVLIPSAPLHRRSSKQSGYRRNLMLDPSLRWDDGKPFLAFLHNTREELREAHQTLDIPRKSF
jgi:hypothetical protein